jgi:alanine-glyoxylate transaminase/serine-glyoxylate transaminase/serine-pyruvate transaminase
MPDTMLDELNPPVRVLLGPGPSNVSSRVLAAMTKPILGYLDPEFIRLMDRVAGMLRQVFGAREGFTLPVSGTGTAGMEAAVANLLEPGDVIVVACHGFFGERIATMATRQGATVAQVPTEWGRTVDPQAVEHELKRHRKVKVLAVVHAETSTGVLQPLGELSALSRRYDALFLVDAVTSLGGCPVEVDATGIDFCYSATQKCLGAPPGLSPVNLTRRALDAMAARKEPPRTWYLDLGLLRQYWEGGTRVYHHTAPMTMIYALYEALRAVLEEGLEQRYARHRRNGRALRAGLEALGVRLLVPEKDCTYQLTTALIPQGVDDVAVRSRLLKEYNVEIGGGLGQLRGRTWRIGLMGESCTAANVLLFLSALEAVLPKAGFEVAVGDGVASASRVLAGAE